jgi:hypothetical protein
MSVTKVLQITSHANFFHLSFAYTVTVYKGKSIDKCMKTQYT